MNSGNVLNQPHPVQQKPTGSFKSPIWKVIFILLLIVDAILGYFLLGHMGYGINLTKTSFILLPIVNLLLLIGYGMLITHGDSLGLLKVGFILLIIVNLMFGYEVYDQQRYGIGTAILWVIPLIFVLAINNLVAVLFYTRTQHPQGIAKVICYTVLIPISIFIILLAGVFIFTWFFRF